MESVIKSGDAGRNLIAFMTLLDLLDSYSLEHKNGKYKLHGQIDFNVKTIEAKSSIMELLQSTGEWLASIPKETWKNKEKEITPWNRGMSK